MRLRRMKIYSTSKATVAAAFFLFMFAVSVAQAFAQTSSEAAMPDGPQANQDSNLAMALGLTPDQVARIRSIRQQNRDAWQAVRQRVNQAQRALDQAIYSDDTSDAVIEQRWREVAEAQAAEVKMRAMTELSIRRVLTNQQLNTFRMIRQQRMREAQMRRRMQNAEERRPLGNGRLENGVAPPPVLGPRQRRRGDGLRRIRP
jgi:Spy/CpxP family protein refolding chaperone